MLQPNRCWLTVIALALAACSSGPDKAPVIAEAYAGPSTLNLHQDIDAKSPTVATAHHGDKLEIVAQRRRWYRVRTAQGLEGWTSDRELLDPSQMQRLRTLAKETEGLPSQGKATTFGALNVHTEPNRQSTSFGQVREKEKFDVIAHRVAERGPQPKRQLVPAKPKAQKAAKKSPSKEKASSIPPPLPPAPPALPADWIELSRNGEPEPAAGEGEKPTGPTDDWTLIRTEAGQSGWVLTSGIYMQIPDEVAQYAEGHRITSYFSLGKVRDGEAQKDIWLWTTSDTLGEDHDFDGYRVFTWSLRRHRYETAFIQRRERGFFPVIAKEGEFSVCLENDDGSRVRKHFMMNGNAVRLDGRQPCGKVLETEAGPQELVPTTAPKNPAAPAGLVDRIKERVNQMFGKK